MEAKKLINDLSVAEKIELYNCLYEDLSGKGIDGDTELAHVNVQEMAVLRAMGGSGTINPHTNLIQFGSGGGGSPPPPPATQTVTQQATIPEELKPFVTDVLEKARAIQERREVEGYVPFSGPRIAEFAPEQTQAFEQIKGLVGQGQQYFDPAARLTAASAFAPTAPQVSQFMNPYLQNVVDIQQREARRAADVERQQLGAQAVGAGGFGGSRQAILEAEQARNLQQQLGDIQTRGLAAAYEDAQARLQQQRERERLAGAQFATLGQVAPGQAFRELSALEAIGAQRQQQQQQALDIAQQEYEIARTFPERTLQDYQSIIRGYAAPIPASTIERSQRTTPAPSFLQQAAGLGGLALGAASAFKKEGGLVSLANGGSPATAASQGVPDDRPSPFPEFLSNLGQRLFGEDEISEQEKLEERSARKLIKQQAEEKAILEEALKDYPQTLQKIVPKIEEQSTYGRQISTLPEERQSTIEQAKKIEEENVLAAKKAKEEKARLAEEKKKAAEAAKIPAKPPVSEPAFGDIGSLIASEKNIRDALTKKYEGQAELLAKQKEDLGYGMADFAQGLLKFAAADPEKATTQQLAEAFSDLPEKAKEATIQKRALELAESGLEADQAIALADRERGVVELNIKLRKALADSGLEPQELEKIMQLARETDDNVFGAALESLTPRGRQAALSIRAARGIDKGPKKPRAALAGRDVPVTAASEGTK
jgi:hypothetical protein